MEAPLLPGFRLDQTFFGLSPDDRPKIHSLLFDIVWAGEGRWSWETIYNMPIFLRSFYIKKIEKIFEDKNTAAEKRAELQRQKQSQRSKPIKGPF